MSHQYPRNTVVSEESESDVGLVWEKCLRVVRESIPYASYETWFEPIRPVKLVGKVITIQVPSQFFFEWLEDNYVNILRKALDYAIGKDGMLEYSIIVDTGNERSEEHTSELQSRENLVCR